MVEKLEVLAVTRFYSPAFRGGGPIRTLTAMAEEHSDSLDFKVLTTNTDLSTTSPLDVSSNSWVRNGHARCFYADWRRFRGRVSFASELRTAHGDFLYLNSLFSPWFSLFPLVMHRLGLTNCDTVVLAPRGELGAGALALKSSKKALFLHVARLIRLHQDVVWHASNNEEAGCISRLFPEATVVVRPNEVLLPPTPEPPTALESGPALKAVYIGRVSPKKGLDLLLDALAKVSEFVELDVIGACDDPGFERSLHEKLKAMSDTVTVRFLPPIPHSEVRQTFANYEVFLFPTSHENFGHVVAESLSASCPVMVADVTPFSDTIRDGGGVLVSDRAVNTWAQAISHYARLPRQTRMTLRRQAGAKFSEWVTNRRSASVFELLRTN